MTDALREMGYQIFGISVDTPENSRDTAEKFNLQFPMLSDSKATLIKQMGLAWYVAGKDDAYYAKLERASGETHHLLSAPATIIVNTDGMIMFEHINPNFKVRPKPEIVLAAAKASLPQPEEA
ncbi:MAG: hypothetical protein D6737_17965 [Chloroflexi bacterium]|nr:MAG: hypothetical protein D6737_17965 [Chloroflexota bacterium]